VGIAKFWKAGSIEENRLVVAILSVPPRWASELGPEPIQSVPPTAATAAGCPPVASCTTAFDRGSIRETAPAYRFATQTDPFETAIPEGPLPTGMVAAT
jgi:hypothetical protein